jgi:membrane-anchored protein YejM (alkaline phosphatase superfamily)
VADNPLLVADRRSDGRGARPRRTNVILVQLESMSWPSLRDRPEALPFLSELGSPGSGVSLQAHYSPWPQTMKAVFSMACGEMPYGDYPPITSVNPSIPVTCLSDTLKLQGYRTGWFTSSDIAYDRQLRFLQHHHLDVVHDMFSIPGADRAWRNSWGIDEAAMVDGVLAWIDQEPGQPFFAFYGQAAGHHPYVFANGPPPPDPTIVAEHEAYVGCALHVDGAVRRLVDGLRARGLVDDTLVVVASDHGEAFDQHGGRTHGNQVYEESVRVPAVIAGPQVRDLADAVRFPTSHIDLAPTILGLLGLEVPPTMKGRDLTRDDSSRLVISGARPPSEQLGVRDGRWKAVLTLETGAVELFDLERDPGEKSNLYDGNRELADRLVDRARHWKQHARNLIENYASIAAGGLKPCVQAETGRGKEAAP